MAEGESPFSKDPEVLYRQLLVLMDHKYGAKIVEVARELSSNIISKLPAGQEGKEKIGLKFSDFLIARVEMHYMPKKLMPMATRKYERAEHELYQTMERELEFKAEKTIPIVIARMKKEIDEKLGIVRNR